MNRKRWIIGAILLILLLSLCAAGSIRVYRQWQEVPGIMGQRDPLRGFGYCSSRPTRPCILSFDLAPEGGMLINVLTEGSAQEFYIKVKSQAGERIYACQPARKYSIHVVCTGDAAPVGETLSFLVVSNEGNTILAQGSFPIIGIALATPEIRITPTPFTHQGPH